MENIQGNLSTILVMIYAVLAPYIGRYMPQEVFVSLGGLVLVTWSAYNPNSYRIFNNHINQVFKKDMDAEDNSGLNDENVSE